MALGTIAAIATAAVSIGQAVAGHEAQEDRAEATRAAAKRARQAEVTDILMREVEERRAARQQERRVGLQADRAEGAARASAAAAGVEGLTMDLLLGDIQGQEGRAKEVIDTNLDTILAQLDRMIEGAFAREESRANQAPEPSMLATGLRIGSGVLNAVSLYDRTSGPSLPEEPEQVTTDREPEVIGTTTGGFRG